jgi:uncharacterized protein (DUF2062 family)
MDPLAPAGPALRTAATRFLARLRELVRGAHTPERIAFSLALGATLGLFPIFGTTTLLCLAVGVAFRLNHPALQLANQLMYPVQLPLLLVFVHVGAVVLRAPAVVMAAPSSWRDGAAVLETLGRAGAQAVLGWALVAPAVLAGLYYATLPALRKLARADADGI